MASTVERRANGEIIYRPDEILDIPNVDLITLLFGMCRVNYSVYIVIIPNEF